MSQTQSMPTLSQNLQKVLVSLKPTGRGVKDKMVLGRTVQSLNMPPQLVTIWWLRITILQILQSKQLN